MSSPPPRLSDQISRRKPLETAISESCQSSPLKKCLSKWDLVGIGVGCAFGPGLFILTGIAAKEKAGPAVVLSYIISGIACIISALCYGEMASRVPISGSAYSYVVVVIGELPAWIIGWELSMEYTLLSGATSRGLAAYFVEIFSVFGVTLPTSFYSIPVNDSVDINIFSFFVMLSCMMFVVLDVKFGATLNKVITFLGISAVMFLIVVGVFYSSLDNWSPFMPFGLHGVFAALPIAFFSYVGFDAVSCSAEESVNPTVDVPFGMLWSVLISIVLYTSVAGVITLMVPYEMISLSAPFAQAFSYHGVTAANAFVSFGCLASLWTTLFTALQSQPRIYFSMSRDGLLPPWFQSVSSYFRTPLNSILFSSLLSGLIGMTFRMEVLADMVAIGTLLAFSLVSLSVMKLRYDVPTSKMAWSFFGIVFLSVVVVYSFANHMLIVGWLAVCALVFLSAVISAFPTTPFLENIYYAPLLPYFPIAGVLMNIFMIMQLPLPTILRLAFWTSLGLVFYFTYSRYHSRLRVSITSPITSSTHSSHSLIE